MEADFHREQYPEYYYSHLHNFTPVIPENQDLHSPSTGDTNNDVNLPLQTENIFSNWNYVFNKDVRKEPDLHNQYGSYINEYISINETMEEPCTSQASFTNLSLATPQIDNPIHESYNELCQYQSNNMYYGSSECDNYVVTNLNTYSSKYSPWANTDDIIEVDDNTPKGLPEEKKSDNRWTIVKLIPSEDGSVKLKIITSQNRKRQRALTSYRIGDSVIACEDCKKMYNLPCMLHILGLVKNNEVTNEAELNDKAYYSTPWPIQIMRLTNNYNWAAVSRTSLPKGLVFGPYEGSNVQTIMTGYSWMVEINSMTSFIDGSDKRYSNWLRFVNCATSQESSNLEAFQYYKNVYYKTTKVIARNEELLVWADTEYARAIEEYMLSQTENAEDFAQGESIRDEIRTPMKIYIPPHHLCYYKKTFPENTPNPMEVTVEDTSYLLSQGESSYESYRNIANIEYSLDSLPKMICPTSNNGLSKSCKNSIKRALVDITNINQLMPYSNATNDDSLLFNKPKQMDFIQPEFDLKENENQLISYRKNNYLNKKIKSNDEKYSSYETEESNYYSFDMNQVDVGDEVMFNDGVGFGNDSNAVFKLPEKVSYCLNCDCSLEKMIDIIIHDTIHAIDLPLQCGYCGIRTDTYLSLKEHLIEHKNAEEFFRLDSSHETPLKVFNTDPVNQMINCYACLQLSNVYTWEKLSMLHMSHENPTTILRNELKKWYNNCTVFKINNQDIEKLLVNEISADEPKRFECIICFEILIDLDNVASHCKLHVNEEQLHQCNTCLAWFNSKTFFDHHSKLHDELHQVGEYMKIDLLIFSTQFKPCLTAKLQWLMYKNTYCRDTFHCPICNESFEKFEESILHSQTCLNKTLKLHDNKLFQTRKSSMLPNTRVSDVSSQCLLPLKKRKQQLDTLHLDFPKILRRIKVRMEHGIPKVSSIYICHLCNYECSDKIEFNIHIKGHSEIIYN